MRITAKDREVLALVERWGFMSVEDLCRFMKYKAPGSIHWRLERLVDNEIIKRRKFVTGEYLYMPLEFQGKISVDSFSHDQTAKWLALYLSEKENCEYLTLREMQRAARLDEGARALSKKIPDFVLVKDGQRIAIEVELTAKDMQRLRKLVGNYMDALLQKEFIQVAYYCGTQAILDRVSRVIAEKGAGQWITAEMLPEEIRQ